MENKELDEARKNPEFLKYLQEKELEAITNQDIQGLYEVLDNLLILDLDEKRINTVYEHILTIAFETMELKLKEKKSLDIFQNDLYYIRAFYEHAIEKWSQENFEGATQLFFILSETIGDEKLSNAIKIHLINCANSFNMDIFYEKYVSGEQMQEDEVYGYFIMNFNFNTIEYIENNTPLLRQLKKQLNGLIS